MLQEQYECQNSREYDADENDILENLGYRDEYDDDCCHFDQCREVSPENIDYREEFDNGNVGSHFDKCLC